MAVEDLVAAIDSADWERFRGPEYYDPERARRSLRDLMLAEDQTAADASYSEVLFGIGNNHAGSYYPAAVCAVPFLVRIATHGLRWPRHGALEVLTDLLTSFHPEEGYETFEGEPIALSRSLARAMEEAGLLTGDEHGAEPTRLLAKLRASTE